jgi:hypothetical protein
MAHYEEVEDLGDLDSTLPDSTLPEASGVELAPPSDAGNGPSVTPRRPHQLELAKTPRLPLC